MKTALERFAPFKSAQKRKRNENKYPNVEPKRKEKNNMIRYSARKVSMNSLISGFRMRKQSAMMAVLLSVSLVLLALTVNPKLATAATTGITFSQVDFVFTRANVPNSDWGRLEVNIAEFTASQGRNKGYLNIYTDAGWMIQNQLIDSVSGMDTIAIYFDLDVPVGTDVTSFSAYIEFTPVAYISFERGMRSSYPVGTVKYNAEGVGTLNTNAISSPPPRLAFSPTGETWDFTKPNYSGENVQTANDQCFPMSIANSLQYLENRYGITVPHDHKIGLKGDDSLVGQLDNASNRGVRNREDGDGVWFDDMLDGKFKYLSDNGLAGKLIHKHQGRGYGVDGYGSGEGSLPPGNFIAYGITSRDESVDGKVTFEWISEQLKICEDVEVVFTFEDATGEITGGHAVRVFGIGKTNGIPYLRYKHDRLQTDQDPTDTQGLEEVQVYVSDLDGDGMPNFGSQDQELCFALAESSGGVGGILVSVDKFGLLAPYIGLTSTIIAATVATAIYVKRVKQRNKTS